MKPKRVNEVVWLCAMKHDGSAHLATVHKTRTNAEHIRSLFTARGSMRIARCRLTEIPAKKRKAKK